MNSWVRESNRGAGKTFRGVTTLPKELHLTVKSLLPIRATTAFLAMYGNVWFTQR